MIKKIIKNIKKIKIGIVFYYKLYRNAKILSFNKKKKILKKNKILIATSSGGLYTHLILESALASGLRNKGAEVHFYYAKEVCHHVSCPTVIQLMKQIISMKAQKVL